MTSHSVSTLISVMTARPAASDIQSPAGLLAVTTLLDLAVAQFAEGREC